jgi:hypothetical protein
VYEIEAQSEYPSEAAGKSIEAETLKTETL